MRLIFGKQKFLQLGGMNRQRYPEVDWNTRNTRFGTPG
jgi:hypothetical protein